MTKTKKFFVVVTSLMLVFAMTGCPQDTKVEYRDRVVGGNGGNNGPTGVPQGTYDAVRRKGELMAALNRDNVTVYVLSEITLDEEVTLRNGQNIVVAKSADNAYGPVVQSAGKVGEQPLFTVVNATGNVALNIGAKLTLSNGSSLTVAGDAKVTVQADATSPRALTDMLHVKSGAKVGVGVSLVNSTVDAGAQLNVNPFANVLFDEGAILVVAAAPGTVTLADEDSGIALMPGSKLAVVADAAVGVTSTDPIGSTDNSVIVVPSGGSAATIAIDEVYTDVGATTEAAANSDLKTALESAKSTINADSTTPTAATPADVTSALQNNAVTKVTYTGNTTLGAVPVGAGQTLVITGTFTQTAIISGAGTLEVTGKLTTGAAHTVATVINSGTITLDTNGSFNGKVTNDGTIILVGTITLGTYTGTGTFEVSNTAALDSAVAFNVPTISLNAAFYDAANSGTGPIVIGAGEADRTDDKAIIIKGLGKTATPALTAGIWIANDNISLQDVNLNVTARTKAPITSWNPGYNAAITIGRSSNGTELLTGTNLPTKNVTVSNSTINIDFSSDTTSTRDFTAGIFVDGSSTQPTSDTLSPAKNITISGNTISATGKGQSSVQGIYVSLYDYSVNITDNTITSKYAEARTTNFFDSPASAIFLNAVYGEDKAGTGTPNIKNNVLNGNNAATALTAYSFYINAYASRVDAHLTAPYEGIASLKANNFGLYETTWALKDSVTDGDGGSTDKTSSYKKVFTELLGNITGTGFGSVASEVTSDDYAFEHYEISAGVITSVSVHGLHLNSESPPKYAKDDIANNKFSTAAGVPTGKDYGSFTVTDGVKGAEGAFKKTYNNADADYIYNNN